MTTTYNPFTTNGLQCVIIYSPTTTWWPVMGENARTLEGDVDGICRGIARITSEIELAYYGYDPQVYGDDGEAIGTDGYPDAVGTWDDDAECIVWERT